MTENAVILVALLALMAINTAVSVAIVRSSSYEGGQILAQAVIIWLVPVIGAMIVGVFLRVQRETPTFDTRAYPERSEKAVVLDLDGSSHDQSSDN